MSNSSWFSLSGTSNMLRPGGLSVAVLFVLMLIFAATNEVSAASATWSGTTDFSWVTGTNWSTTPVPGAGDTATFNGAGNGNTVITIDSGRNVGSITFDTSSAAAYTIGSAGVGLGNTLTLTSGGAITVNSSVTQTQAFNAPLVIGSAGGSTYTVTMAGAGALRFQGPITSAGLSGTTTLTVNASAGITTISGDITDSGTGTSTALNQGGSGTLILSGHNTYSGTTFLNGYGAVRADDGVGFSPNSNIVESAAAIQTSTNFLRSIGPGPGQISFAQGAATVDFTAVGGNIVVALGGTSNPTQLTMGSGNNFNVSNFLLNDGYGGGPTGTVDFRNPINLNGATANFGGRGNNGTTTLVTLSGVISGTGTLNFIYGSGNTALTGANTFDAPFTLGAHSTIYVSSIGHIGSTSSNLGAPSTIANGKITLGNGSGGGNIVYSGSGETTDRTFLLACNNVGINQSGTGLLKFTGDFTMISIYHQVLPFTLSGSTAGAGEISGAIADDPGHLSPLELDKTGTGTWTLSGTNTYTAPTTISAGMLQFAKAASLYNNNTAGTGWTAANIIVANGATLALNVGGSGEFTASDVATISGLGGVIVVTPVGFNNGAILGLDTTNASGGNFTYSATLANPNAGANMLNLNKLGANSLTLSGPNTYTGTTTVTQGSLIAGANAPSGSAGAFGNTTSAVNLGSTTATGAASILTSGAFTVARNITEVSSATNASFTIGGNQTSGTSTYTGNITLTKDTTLTSAAGGEVDFTTGVISGAFNTIINGGGTVKLTGTNTFGGSGKSVTIQGGTTLIAAASVNLGDSSNSLIFNNGILQLSPAFDPSTKTMTFNSGGATFDTNGSDDTFANAVGNSGAGGLTKIGSGALTLSAANTYNGVTSITSGKITLKHNEGLGATSGGTIVSSGAALAIDGTAGTRTIGAEALTLNGAGVTGSPAGALQNVAGNNIYGGLITLGSNATIQSDADSLDLSNLGTITGSGYTLTVAGSGNGNIAGNIGTGAGGLTKTGSGTWTVSGANTYTGTTAVTAGTLVVATTSALGGGGAVDIDSGGTVAAGGDFTFNNNVVNNGKIDLNGDHNVIIAAGKTLSGTGMLMDSVGDGAAHVTVMGTLSPGTSPGTITVDSFVTVTLGAGARTIWQLGAEVADGEGGTPGTSWDNFVLNDSAMGLNGTLEIDLLGIDFSANSYWESSHTYTMFGGAGGVSGLFTSYDGDYTYTNGSGTGTFVYTENSNVLNYNWVAVPEPQTWALAALGVSAVLFRLRRQRRS